MELRTLRVLARLARIPSRLTIAVSARSARTSGASSKRVVGSNLLAEDERRGWDGAAVRFAHPRSSRESSG